MGELTTAVKYGTNIVLVLVNNSELGMITKEQRSAGLETWQTGLHNPRFADYARPWGAWGQRVERPGDLGAALAEALAQTRPALVEVMVDPDLV